MSDGLRAAIERIQENCAMHIQREIDSRARLETKVSQVVDDVRGINTFLVKGNGKSISERLAIVETKVNTIASNVESIEQKLDKRTIMDGSRRTTLLKFWSPIIVSLIALATALLTAILMPRPS